MVEYDGTIAYYDVEFESLIEPDFLTSVDPELRDEFKNGVGDCEIICSDGKSIKAHSCVLASQSSVMRRELTNLKLDCPFSSVTMDLILRQMYHCQVRFTCLLHVIEVILALGHYRLKVNEDSIYGVISSLCEKHKEQNSVNLCRDLLLILQGDASDGYKPFDSCLKPLTDDIIDILVDYVKNRIMPTPLDPVKIANQVYEQLQKNEPIGKEHSIWSHLAFHFDEKKTNQNDVFNAIMTRQTVLQQVVINAIPSIHVADAKRMRIENEPWE